MTIEILALTNDATINTFFSVGYYLAVAFTPFFTMIAMFRN